MYLNSFPPCSKVYDWLRCDDRENFVQNPNITKAILLVSEPELLKPFLVFLLRLLFFLMLR